MGDIQDALRRGTVSLVYGRSYRMPLGGGWGGGGRVRSEVKCRVVFVYTGNVWLSYACTCSSTCNQVLMFILISMVTTPACMWYISGNHTYL